MGHRVSATSLVSCLSHLACIYSKEMFGKNELGSSFEVPNALIALHTCGELARIPLPRVQVRLLLSAAADWSKSRSLAGNMRVLAAHFETKAYQVGLAVGLFVVCSQKKKS